MNSVLPKNDSNTAFTGFPILALTTSSDSGFRPKINR